MDVVTDPLVLVAHGSRDDASHACVEDIVAAVRTALTGVDVRLSYVDVRGPKVDEAVAGLDRAVVVPAFLASGYHVRTDLPAQLAACGVALERFSVTPAIGPDPLLAHAARQRLAEAGWRYGDAVGLAAAGSAAPAAPGGGRGGGRVAGGGGWRDGCSRWRSGARSGWGSSPRRRRASTRRSRACGRPGSNGSRWRRGCSRRVSSTRGWARRGRTWCPRPWVRTPTSSPRSSPATAP